MKISAVMIVKNEEKRIKRCIRSFTKCVDEIVVVTTGETDSTTFPLIDLGFELEPHDKGSTRRIYQHLWQDSFSEARNFALSKATGDWILVVDADEWFDPSETEKIRPLLESLGPEFDSVISSVRNFYGNGAVSEIPAMRLFRNGHNFYYSGAIHNQLMGPGLNSHERMKVSNIKLNHDGYALAPATMEKKRMRSFQMIDKQLQEKPDDGTTLFHHARTALYAKFHSVAQSSAIKLISKLEESHSKDVTLFHSVYYTWFLSHYAMNTEAQCVEKLVRITGQYPEYLDGFFALIAIFSRRNERVKAEEYFEKYVKLLPKFQRGEIKSPVEMMTIANEPHARIMMADMYRRTFRASELADQTQCLLGMMTKFEYKLADGTTTTYTMKGGK